MNDDWKNFTPRANAPIAAQTVDNQSLLDLAAIDTMDAIALRDLIRTCYGTIAGYALLNDDEKAEAARLKLYSLGMTSNEVHKVVPALDKWFDRTQGKAPQSISMDVRDDRLDKMPIDDLLRLAAMMREPMIIAPMPKKLDDN